MAKVLKLCFSFLSFFWLSAIFSFDESTLGKVDNNPMCYVGGGSNALFVLEKHCYMFYSYRVLGESKQLGNASIISNIGISAIVKQQLNYTIWYNSEYIFKGNALKRTYRLVRFGVRFLKRQYRKRRV